MPIPLGTFLVRSSPGVPFLVSDTDLRGGYRVVADHAARDGLHTASRVPGMLVLTQNDGVIWQLLQGNTDWTEWNAPSGGGGGSGSDFITSVVSPLEVDVSGSLSVAENRVLPAIGSAGQIPVRQSNGSVLWESFSAGGSVGTRATLTKSDFVPLPATTDVNFTLSMSRTCMLMRVEVNAPDLLVQCFGTPSRDEENPYTFKSATGRLFDTGVSVLPDDSLQYNRRYAFVANQEAPTTGDMYWSITNQGGVSVTPVLTVTYLVLE